MPNPTHAWYVSTTGADTNAGAEAVDDEQFGATLKLILDAKMNGKSDSR
jgi:hypothetical protein